MQNGKVKVGLMAVGLSAYWGQFHGMREKCEHNHSLIAQKFSKAQTELVDLGIVDSEQLGRMASERFITERIDILFCNIMTYSASEYLAATVRELSIPVVLLNIQPRMALDWERVKGIGDWLSEGITCAAVPEATAVLMRLNKVFGTITGYMENDATVDNEINMWCMAAKVQNKLSKQNMGLFGRSFGGMMDLCVDETKIFEVFGTYIHHLDWQEIIDRANQADTEKINEQLKLMKRMFEMDSTIDKSDMDLIARTAAALMEMADKYNLHAYASHYEYEGPAEHKDLVASLNPALTLVMTQGVSSVPEGDMKAAIAMTILKTIAGNAMTAELYSMDFEKDICLIGHSGACDANIATEKAVLKMSEVLHGKKGKGYLAQFYHQPGPVTMLAMTQAADGSFYLVAAEGTSVDGPVLSLGDTNLRVKFPISVKQFVDQWCDEGPTHHGVLSNGWHIDYIAVTAKVLGLELRVITKENVNKHDIAEVENV